MTSQPDELTFVVPRYLRVLTFNLQVGISTNAYYQYLTHSWQHILPNAKRSERLRLIGSQLVNFDLVGLQEVDGGSFRSNHLNQIAYLGHHGHFPYRFSQLNRNLGKLAQHSNALLSRIPATKVMSYRLPGPRGRGAIYARFGNGPNALHIFVAHLALGAKTQRRQLDYLSALIQPYQHVILMGDLNCTLEQMRFHPQLFDALDLPPLNSQLSYPAWQPKQALDHILPSQTLKVSQYQVLDQLYSDHLPVRADIELPESCRQALTEAWQLHHPTSQMIYL